MAVKGSLEEMGLDDILQTMELCEKTGEIKIWPWPNGLCGSIYIKEGKIVHAELFDGEKVVKSGKEALIEITLFSQGRFEINMGVTTDIETIKDMTVDYLRLKKTDIQTFKQNAVLILKEILPAWLSSLGEKKEHLEKDLLKIIKYAKP